MAKRNPEKVKRVLTPLPGWMSLPRAAAELNVTRARTFQMVDEYLFREVHVVPGTGDRPAVILVRESEVAELKAKQAAEVARVQAVEAAREQAPVAQEEPVLV